MWPTLPDPYTSADSPLAAHCLLWLPVVMPDEGGCMRRLGEVYEIYLTPDRTLLLGMTVFHSANILGGGELLWLPQAYIARLTAQAVQVAAQRDLLELDLDWRTAQIAHSLELVRSRPLLSGIAPVAPELMIEPTTCRVLAPS